MKGQGCGWVPAQRRGEAGEVGAGSMCGCGLRAEGWTFTSGATGRNEAEGKSLQGTGELEGEGSSTGQ